MRTRSLATFGLLAAIVAFWWVAMGGAAPAHSRQSSVDPPFEPAPAAKRKSEAPAHPATGTAAPAAVIAHAPVPEAAIDDDRLEVPEHRPDDFTPEERAERARERSELTDRWARQERERNDDARASTENALGEALADASLSAGSIDSVDCRRSICRLELSTVGVGIAPLEEVDGIITAIRQLRDTWLLATEVQPGSWRVEAFAATEGYGLTGDHIE